MAETTTQPNNKRIERKKTAVPRLGVGKSFFEENLVLSDPDERHVPGIVRNDGTPIPRVKPVPLGAYAVGFYSADIDGLIEAMRDAKRIAERWPSRSAREAKTTERPSRPEPVKRSRTVRR
jgi:hypothetical protein